MPPRRRVPFSDADALELLQSPPPGVGKDDLLRSFIFDYDRPDLVQRAVERGVMDPNYRVAMGDIPMPFAHMAATGGAVGLLQCLIEGHGVDANAVAGDGLTPLQRAVTEGKEAAALYLINEAPGCDLDARGPKGVTALMVAAWEGLLAATKALVARGADVQAVDAKGMTALAHAIVEDAEEAALFLVESAGAAWDVGPDPWTAICSAARHGLARVARAIVRRMRADGLAEAAVVSHMDKAAATAVHFRKLAVLRALVAEGLNVTRMAVVRGGTKGSYHSGYLHLACEAGVDDMAAFFIEQGCDPLQPDPKGVMPHHVAAMRGNLAHLKWLLTTYPAIPVDAEMGGRCKGSALQLALVQHHDAMVKWLVESAGADPRRKMQGEDGLWRSTSEYAEADGLRSLARFLREKEAALTAAEEAAARAEEEAREAAARRARNEKRRLKQKKAKARRRSGEGKEEEEEEQEEEGKEEEVAADEAMGSLAAAVAGLGAADAADKSPPPPPLEEYLDAQVPEGLVCPISLQLLQDPVLLVGVGCSYSRAAIEAHFAACRDRGRPLTSPKTNLAIDAAQAVLIPNVALRALASDYREAKTKEWKGLGSGGGRA